MTEGDHKHLQYDKLITVIENVACDDEVKRRLIEVLKDWTQVLGFRLCEANKDLLHVLLELFLKDDEEVSNQVNA